MKLFIGATALAVFLMLLICGAFGQDNTKSANWLQGNHDEYQTNRIQMLENTPNFNLTISFDAHFDTRLVLADVQRKILITNYAIYDTERFPQFYQFGLAQVDLTNGNLTYSHVSNTTEWGRFFKDSVVFEVSF